MDRLPPRNRGLEPADAGRDALDQFLLADRIRLMYAHRLAPFAPRGVGWGELRELGLERRAALVFVVSRVGEHPALGCGPRLVLLDHDAQPVDLLLQRRALFVGLPTLAVLGK
jgi:hypothetical protein